MQKFLMTKIATGFSALVLMFSAYSVVAMHHGESAHEHGEKMSDSSVLKITEAWSPAAPSVVPVRAGYFSVFNDSPSVVTIVGAKSPMFEKIEIHQTTIKDGVSSMSAVKGITIPSGETVSLKPGGIHLMLMQAKGDIAIGSMLPVMLLLEKGEPVMIELMVKKAKSTKMDHSHHHAHH